MSPNPVTGAAAWTAALAVDVIAVVVAAAVLGWDRWCPAGGAGCPAAGDRAGRDAWVLAVLAGVLLGVALLALVRGRLLLAAGQVALVVVLAVLAARALPQAFDQLRTKTHLWTTASEFEFPT